jgi:5-methyltetrahydrofolate--homocysteine methyltransferase
VKIEPMYSNVTVHVLDASKSVPVASGLLSDSKADVIKKIKIDNEDVRIQNAKRRARKVFASLEKSRATPSVIDWSAYEPVTPQFIGNKTFKNYSLAEIAERFDWEPFFKTWELHGKYPAILSDEVVGEEATKLFADAKQKLQEIIDKNQLVCHGVIGLYPANAVDNDNTEIYDDNDRQSIKARLHHLRQQVDRPAGRPYRSLADFIAPKVSNKHDHMGAFAVSCFGADELAKKYEEDHDDYNSIMVKALADRFAEAFAEVLHERVRKEFWGYANDESLSNSQLIKEAYAGIRPAPGYPACPEHSEKTTLWELLKVDEAIGSILTDSYAMYPASSVSGWYFAHPDARYFALGQIAKDQVENYAERKSWDMNTTERWLQPALGY